MELFKTRPSAPTPPTAVQKAAAALGLTLVVGSERLPVDGVVAWVRPQQRAVGIRFVEVPEEIRIRLLMLMRTVVAEHA